MISKQDNKQTYKIVSLLYTTPGSYDFQSREASLEIFPTSLGVVYSGGRKKKRKNTYNSRSNPYFLVKLRSAIDEGIQKKTKPGQLLWEPQT